MNKINNGKVINAPQNTDNISGYPVYLASLPIGERQAMGWYANLVIDNNITEPIAIPEEDSIHIPPPTVDTTLPPFNISKRALRKAMIAIGKESELDAYLESSTDIKKAWDEAICLSSDDPMIVAAIPAFSSLLPEGTDIIKFLRSCSIQL